jgi:nuclease HARBI1
MKVFKKDIRRNLPLTQRDLYGFSQLDMQNLKMLSKCCLLTAAAFRKAKLANKHEKAKQVLKLLLCLFGEMRAVCTTEIPAGYLRPNRRNLPCKRFEDFGLDIYSSKFRFRNVDDMWRLVHGFGLPLTIKVHSYRFTCQEVLMISLMRLAYPHRWTDICDSFPNRSPSQCQKAFYWFLDFMIFNWGYLLLNNMEYWLDTLPLSAEAIRMKLANLPNEDNRLYLEEDDFSICAFIDNTLIAMCRPGGPITGGEGAERVPKIVQQAWWTGWKKLHGLKWQTVLLANGMDLNVWGPVSCRHNDLYTLAHSDILERFAALQANNERKYKMYGDSAYYEDDYMETGNGRGMSACRESIEWRYRDLKQYWKYCDYKHCLQLRKQPVGKIVLVAMILSNAHCCMYGSEITSYFDLAPPEFEHWISQGPCARPIPNNLFLDNNAIDNDDEEEDSSDDDGGNDV